MIFQQKKQYQVIDLKKFVQKFDLNKITKQ
jgi:hypothetical protein